LTRVMASPSTEPIFASVADSIDLGAPPLGNATGSPAPAVSAAGEAETYVVCHPVLDLEKATNYSSSIAKSAISWKVVLFEIQHTKAMPYWRRVIGIF
jgi:hypothetical protein